MNRIWIHNELIPKFLNLSCFTNFLLRLNAPESPETGSFDEICKKNFKKTTNGVAEIHIDKTKILYKK